MLLSAVHLLIYKHIKLNFHISDCSLAGHRAAVTRKLSSSKTAISVANTVLVTVKSNVELLRARWSKCLDVWDQYISERDSQYNGKCQRSIKCNTCHKGNHNKIFRYSNFRTKPQNVTKSNNAYNFAHAEVDDVVLSNQWTSYKYSSALATAKVIVFNSKNSMSASAHCFFDHGSQISFITSKLVNILQLETIENRELVLQGFHSRPTESGFYIVTSLVSLERKVKKISVAVDCLPNSISAPEMLQSEGIKVEDQISSDTISDIDLMIGSDFFCRLC